MSQKVIILGLAKEKSQNHFKSSIMKLIISAIAISLFSLSFNSCSTHQSCPAYSDSINNGMEFDNASEEIKELNIENV